MRFSSMINQMDELQLLSTVDLTSRLEYELLDRNGTWQLEEEDKQDPQQSNTSCRRRLSFSLAVRKGRFARYSLLIGSRYGVWSMADRRFIKRTNFYHYHHLTQGIKDVRQAYTALIFDGFYNISSYPGFLYKLLVRPRRTLQIMRALLFYYHVFMAKDCGMECWPANVHGKDMREELSSLRHRQVDVCRRRMTPVQRQRILVIYQRQSRGTMFGLGLIFSVLLVLLVIIGWLLTYYWFGDRSHVRSSVVDADLKGPCAGTGNQVLPTGFSDPQNTNAAGMCLNDEADGTHWSPDGQLHWSTATSILDLQSSLQVQMSKKAGVCRVVKLCNS